VKPRTVCVCPERKAPEPDGVDQVHPLGAVGDIDRRIEVQQEDADDLAEAEGDDREVVAAQSQRGRAEQHAEDAGERRARRQQEPERQVEIEVRGGEQRVEVSAHCEEGDVAQVEQPGVADHDIQPQREHDVEQREGGDAHPGAADRPVGDERQRDEQEREREGGGPYQSGIAPKLLPVVRKQEHIQPQINADKR